MTPTARTLGYLRRLGFIAAVVETWIPHVDRRRDLFGFADILAAHPRDQIFLLVQTTSLSNLPARVTKVRQAPAAEYWLRAGGKIECHGWTRRPEGWQVKVVEIEAETMQPVVTHCPRRRRPSRFQQGTLFT